MNFYMSRAGREIYETLKKEWKIKDPSDVDYRIYADYLAIKFPPAYASWLLEIRRNDGTAHLKDAPNNFDLRDHVSGYQYLTEQYVTKDFQRTDLLKMIPILNAYDVAAIEKVANRCKHLNHFTIPYLAAAMEQEGGAAIEELRREQRLDQRISLSTLLELPSIRAKEGEMRRKIDELAQDRRIDRFLSGENEEIPKP